MKKSFKKAVNSRVLIVVIVIVLMAAILVQRLFQLQIVQGEEKLPWKYI